jgi:hypothetical protein
MLFWQSTMDVAVNGDRLGCGHGWRRFVFQKRVLTGRTHGIAVDVHSVVRGGSYFLMRLGLLFRDGGLVFPESPAVFSFSRVGRGSVIFLDDNLTAGCP